MATDRALLANAETAQEIAPALVRFQNHVPEAATEISALVSELYAISAALFQLKTALGEPRNARYRNLVDEDKRVVLRSLEYTFKDIHRLLRALDSRSYRTTREAYRDVWIEIDDYFRAESNNSLLTRLGYYKCFVDDLTPIVQGRPEGPEVNILFDRIDRLLSVQDERLAKDLEELALGTPRVRSWERVRGERPAAASPGAPPRRTGGGGGGSGGGGGDRGGGDNRKRPAFQSPASPIFSESDTYVPPLTPSSPSVVTSATPTTGSASTPPSSAESVMFDHWLPRAFDQSRPTTTFVSNGTESYFHGDHMSGVTNKLRTNEYDELLRIPFESGGQIEIRLYRRPTDNKARIYCRMQRADVRVISCEAITSLKVYRQHQDACLQLCTKGDRRNERILWTSLRFTSYERMVLFFCSFLALKSQDISNPTRLDDHVLDGETPIFSAKIIDDQYEHALQIFKDEDSGGMRLQASVLSGPLKRSPVWTAFINYRIQARSWARVHERDRKRLFLGDLQRYIFTGDYIPQFGPHGEHELLFKTGNDAEKFMQVIDDLAEGRI